jgi:hypothetical protein
VFVPTSVAAVAANAEGMRFGHLLPSANKLRSSSKGWRICEQGIAVALQPRALAENLKSPHFSLLSVRVAGQPIACAPASVSVSPCALAKSCVLSGRSVRIFLVGCCRRRLYADSDRPLPQALEPTNQELRVAWHLWCMNPSRLSNSLQTFGFPSATRCCLTLRSSGPPQARRLGREAVRHIIRLAAQAPCRWCPLSSNVRPARSLRGSCSGVSKQRAHGQQNASAACPLPAAARTIPTTISARFACG